MSRDLAPLSAGPDRWRIESRCAVMHTRGGQTFLRGARRSCGSSSLREGPSWQTCGYGVVVYVWDAHAGDTDPSRRRVPAPAGGRAGGRPAPGPDDLGNTVHPSATCGKKAARVPCARLCSRRVNRGTAGAACTRTTWAPWTGVQDGGSPRPPRPFRAQGSAHRTRSVCPSVTQLSRLTWAWPGCSSLHESVKVCVSVRVCFCACLCLSV